MARTKLSALVGLQAVDGPQAVPVAGGKASREMPARGKYPPKVSFYQDPEGTERMRGTILYTQVVEGPRSLSQFIHNAVMAEVERLEAKYNDGQPFPPIGSGELSKAVLGGSIHESPVGRGGRVGCPGG